MLVDAWKDRVFFLSLLDGIWNPSQTLLVVRLHKIYMFDIIKYFELHTVIFLIYILFEVTSTGILNSDVFIYDLFFLIYFLIMMIITHYLI